MSLQREGLFSNFVEEDEEFTEEQEVEEEIHEEEQESPTNNFLKNESLKR
jgi:hypothetical protein